ncbi:Ca-activated chloride channel family protein [Sanguibacter gelidistatuariae]|uniref:Ca-activated chloride channel family protein n=1 Tax=Sanguibacter gelidistatuariae TaxID=1814289 RepID=A0A1G6HCQ3_9MICO|nr:Ca-activated chloride channel family protein [Sanguibacter gelidistatuariae]
MTATGAVLFAAGPAGPAGPAGRILAAEQVTSSIAWPWAIAVVLVVVAAAGGLAWYFARNPTIKPTEEAVWVANSDYVEQIPEFRSWVRRYRGLQWAGIAAIALGALASAFIAARPVDIAVSNSKLATRDIVLCLDVSGSMIEYDMEMVDVFAELVDSFEGERIALSIFNSTSRTVFPLTDDYALVRDELEAAKEALDPEVLYSEDNDLIDKYLLFSAGTMGTMEGSSLIGDGLANCAMQFDESETERSRSIVLATDNEIMGTPIYTLQEAVDFTQERGIAINGLYGAGDFGPDAQYAGEYKDAIEGAGGRYYYSDDPTAVDEMVKEVQAQQAVDLDATPEVTSTDKAGPWFAWVLVAVVGLVLVQWRLRE